MDPVFINKRVQSEICYKTIDKLSDLSLINEYTKCKSVKQSINKLTKILNEEKYR